MKKILFSGESIKGIPENKTKEFSIHSPIQRGDLNSIKVNPLNPCIVLILDGVYGAYLSVTPTECRDFMERGGILVGASSMGALRASELWSVGMIGLGNVYAMLRLGYLRSDADVAVAYNNAFEEITISIVHVRAILAKLEEDNDIALVISRQMLLTARQTIWFERYWDKVLEEWRKKFELSAEITVKADALYRDPFYHPKKKDALTSINTIIAKRWPQN